MKNVLVVDYCIGELGGYVKRILDAFLSAVAKEHSVERVDLTKTPITPLDEHTLKRRDQLIAAGQFDDPMFVRAKQFAAADVIVVAAPELAPNIPAKVATYFERVFCPGVTYAIERHKQWYEGIRRAGALLYITARELDTPDEYSAEWYYLKGVEALMGLKPYMISARGLKTAFSIEGIEYQVNGACEKAKRFADQ